MRKINDGPMASDIEDRVVFRDIDVGELLGAGELLLDGVVIEELGAQIVLLECLDAAFVDGRVGTLGGGKVDRGMGCDLIVWVGSFWEVPALFVVSVFCSRRPEWYCSQSGHRRESCRRK